jgi:hypothetical protein
MTYPEHRGGGWYELSDGSTVQGRDEAEEAQALLDDADEAEELEDTADALGFEEIEPAPVPEPDPAPPITTPHYDEVLAARREMDQAHNRVVAAERTLRSAKTIMSDFTIRDREVALARAAVNEARAEAGAATARFQELKYRSNR